MKCCNYTRWWDKIFIILLLLFVSISVYSVEETKTLVAQPLKKEKIESSLSQKNFKSKIVFIANRDLQIYPALYKKWSIRLDGKVSYLVTSFKNLFKTKKKKKLQPLQ